MIYVFRSSDWDPINNLELAAERPRRQSAVLAHGSWGVHGNIVADDLIAVFALAPSVGVVPAATGDVFPSSDPFYRELLALKANIGLSTSSRWWNLPPEPTLAGRSVSVTAFFLAKTAVRHRAPISDLSVTHIWPLLADCGPS